VRYNREQGWQRSLERYLDRAIVLHTPHIDVFCQSLPG